MAVNFYGLKDAFIQTSFGGLCLGGAYVIGSQLYKSESSVHFSAKVMRYDIPLIVSISLVVKGIIFGYFFKWEEETLKAKLLGALIIFSSAVTLYEITKSGANGNKIAAHLMTVLATSLATIGTFAGLMGIALGLQTGYRAFRH